MSTNILNKEYEQLQQSISKLRKQCYESLADDNIIASEEIPTSAPLIPQIELKVDYEQFEMFMIQIVELIEEKQPQLKEQFKSFRSILNVEVSEQLFTAAIEVNTSFFNKLSKENEIDEWIVPFIAENAVRPYLQKAQEQLEEPLSKITGPKQCPSCGELPRIATINKDGKKNIVCPRCYYEWQEKKISCPHCGTDNHEHIVILQVDEDSKSEIYSCKNCNSYTKVIKVSEMLSVPTPDMLDVKSIHLDYVAQDKGFGSKKVKDTDH